MTQPLAEIRCVRCRAAIAPTETVCPSCGLSLEPAAGSTRLEEALPSRVVRTIPQRPDPDAVPPWRRRVLGGVAIFALALAAYLVYAGRIDREAQLDRWLAQLKAELRDPKSDGWQQLDDGQERQGWLVLQGSSRDRSLLDRVPLPPHFTPFPRRLRVGSNASGLPSGDRYLIGSVGPWPSSLSATYSVPFDKGRLVLFEFERWSLLLQPFALGSIFLLPGLVVGLDRATVASYRRRQKRAYDEYERGRTQELYAARECVASARKLVAADEPAKALVSLNEALAILPDYAEALELRELVRGQVAGEASVVPVDLAPPVADVSEVIYLRVVGTPFAYRASSNAATIRVGRRRPSEPGESEPNDLVIRVPASTDRTLRISRQHFEINRIGSEYFVVDHSGGRTRLNGRVLEKGRPAKIVSGDRLLIADVMTLEVSIRPVAPQSAGEVLRLGVETPRFNIEATVGDLLTEE